MLTDRGDRRMTMKLYRRRPTAGASRRRWSEGLSRTAALAPLGCRAAAQPGGRDDQPADRGRGHRRCCCVLTFVVLVVGYAIGFWSLPA